MRFTWLLPACLALAGCGGPTPVPETDAAKGREALKTVLDKWKNGGAVDELKPTVVREPDWQAGCKLKNFEIAADDRRTGADLLVSVKLQLTRPDGQPVEKKVNYAVGVGPPTVVVRGE